MAIELPDWLTDAFNLAGLPWPGVDEDQLRAWAAGVRQFAGDITDNSSQVSQTMSDLADSCRSSVIGGVARQYESHHQLLTGLRGPMDDFATALDYAADAVVAQKWVVIGAATALAAEFTATQAGAILTLGADEAALPAEIATAQAIVKFALRDLEAVVIGRLINFGAAELSDHLNSSIVALADDAWSAGMETEGVTVAYEKIQDAARRLRARAEDAEETGDRAHAQNAGRDLADNSGGGGWGEIIAALRQGLLDVAADLFRNLPAAIARMLREIAQALEKFAARLKSADDEAAPAPVANTATDRPATADGIPPGDPVSAANGSQQLFDRMFPGLRDVNAPRLHLGEEWQNNCQSCVVAVDRTLGGHPSTALPVSKIHSPWPDSVTKTIGGGTPFTQVTGYNEITSQMEKAGDGARGVVWGRRYMLDENGPVETRGHVFNVVNQDGRVYYVDGQTGRFATLEHFSYLYLLRTH